MKKTSMIQIAAPCLIVAVIAGIYLAKTSPQTAQVHDCTVKVSSPANAADFSLTATEMIDFSTLSAHGLPIIVDYGSHSCRACRQMTPVLEKLNQELRHVAIIKFADVWEYAQVANNVPIQLIPSQVFVGADGKPFVPSKKLAGWINFLLHRSRETGEHIFTIHQGGLTEQQIRMILVEMGVNQ